MQEPIHSKPMITDPAEAWRERDLSVLWHPCTQMREHGLSGDRVRFSMPRPASVSRRRMVLMIGVIGVIVSRLTLILCGRHVTAHKEP